MLTVENLCVSYKKISVLRDVSFSLRAGKITVLLGKNGAGKTSLFRCIGGQLPCTGQILLDGVPLEKFSPTERAKKVGILPQFLPDTGFTVQELVSLGRNPYVGPNGRLTETDRQAIGLALDLTQMESMAARQIHTLSGGEKQRAYLAMALAQDTPFVLLDEPASSLDTDARRRLLCLCRELADNHEKTLFVILHDLSEAFALADDVVILSDGTAVYSGTAENCLAYGLPEKYFGVQRYFCTNGVENRIFFR